MFLLRKNLFLPGSELKTTFMTPFVLLQGESLLHKNTSVSVGEKPLPMAQGGERTRVRGREKALLKNVFKY